MAAVSLTLGSNEYPLTVVDGTALTLSLSGPAGPAGPAGPNTVSTSTTTNLTGYIYGNGTTVGGATAATSAATANTLVLRNASGDASFGAINASSTIITTGDDATITTSGVGAYVSTFGADAFISTSGTNASISTSGSNADIFTVGDDATISTEGANASIITTGTDAYIATTGINSAIFTQGTNATIGTTGADAFITTSGINAAIRTFGNFGNITTSGTNAYITTSGINAPITTSGADAHIATYGAAAYIQSRATFKLFNGTYTTTLSHSPTANRAIAFPNDTGTVALINPSSGTQTFSGAQIFSTRPTSSGTVTPDGNSLMTRDDVASHAYFSRRLFGNCSGTTGGGGSGATSRRAAAQGLFDGDLQTTATSGAFYKINIVSGVGISSLMGLPSSGSVNLSSKWSMFFRIAAQMGTNSHIYLCIGADGVSGIPSSGTSVGMEITSATVARLFRCNAGAAVYSSDATISGITTTTSTTDLFFWVDNSGTGTLSLFFAPKLFSAAMPAKPASAIATLSGVASGFTGGDVAMYLRATAANPSVFTGLTMRDVVFTEY